MSEWNVDSSRPPTRHEYQPFSPLMFHAPPVIPDILQMDTNRKRYRGITIEIETSLSVVMVPILLLDV